MLKTLLDAKIGLVSRAESVRISAQRLRTPKVPPSSFLSLLSQPPQPVPS
jgi:hypothetical protein